MNLVSVSRFYIKEHCKEHFIVNNIFLNIEENLLYFKFVLKIEHESGALKINQIRGYCLKIKARIY